MSLVGFSARNHPQQAVKDSVDDRRTPRALFDPLHAQHQFTVDVAASAENALLPKFYTRETDGLAHSWAGERVWCNPPYSRLEAWLHKAWNEMYGGCESVVMLLPANRCEQRWWQHYVEGARDRGPNESGITLTTQFLPGRLRMAPPDYPTPAKGDRPPFGCVLLTFSRPSFPTAEPTNG